jgi:hypothetical protein
MLTPVSGPPPGGMTISVIELAGKVAENPLATTG